MVSRVLIYFLLVAGCNSEPNYSIHELPSGKKLKVIALGRIYFTEDEPALMLKYLTDIPIDDEEALRLEAKEIWPVFRVNVENAKLTAGILSAQGPAKNIFGSFITTNRSYQFIWTKQEDGMWQPIGKKARRKDVRRADE